MLVKDMFYCEVICLLLMPIYPLNDEILSKQHWTEDIRVQRPLEIHIVFFSKVEEQ